MGLKARADTRQFRDYDRLLELHIKLKALFRKRPQQEAVRANEPHLRRKL